MEILYSEIFDEFKAAENKNQRLDVLKKHGHARFKQFLSFCFSDNIVFDTPVPKYRPALEPAGLNYTYLHNEVLKLHRFVKGSNIPEKKRMQLLLVILESLHADEAELLANLIGYKDLKIRYLTRKLVEEAFPDIF